MADHPTLDVDRAVDVFDRHRVCYLLFGGKLEALRAAAPDDEHP